MLLFIRQVTITQIQNIVITILATSLHQLMMCIDYNKKLLCQIRIYEKVSIKYKVNFEHTFTATDELFILESGTTTVDPSLFHSISGTWDKIEYNNNHCWLISAPNSAYILQPNTIQSNWIPKEGWFGEYTALEHPFDSSFCSQFGLPVITIDEDFHLKKTR